MRRKRPAARSSAICCGATAPSRSSNERDAAAQVVGLGIVGGDQLADEKRSRPSTRMFRRPSSSSSMTSWTAAVQPLRRHLVVVGEHDAEHVARRPAVARSAPCSAPRRCAAAGSRRAAGPAAAGTARWCRQSWACQASTTASSLPSVAASGSSSKPGSATIHSCNVDEVEVERVGVGVLVEQRERDVVGLVPGDAHEAAPFAVGPSPATLHTLTLPRNATPGPPAPVSGAACDRRTWCIRARGRRQRRCRHRGARRRTIAASAASNDG